MKKCELCESAARLYCGSDQASLCWDCDSRVHSANFIVSKHTRTLLCHSCQSPTPWTGSGPKMDPTISVCEACFTRNSHGNHDDLANGSIHDGDGSHECHDDDDDDDTENQVVPLSLSPSLVSSSSNSEDYFGNRDGSCNSRLGFSATNPIKENFRSPENDMEMTEEDKKNVEKIRPWTWR